MEWSIGALLLLVVLCLVLGMALRRALATAAASRGDVDILKAELKRVEAEALRLQVVRRDFVANISHELRTPLASIKLLVETLESGALFDDEVAGEFTHKIGQETEHLIGMTQELLDLARLEAAPAMQPAPLDPYAVVVDVADRLCQLARDERVVVRIDAVKGLPLVWADREQTGRVLVNLLHNAITFTPAGGEVTISGCAEARTVSLSVTDTGPGIPPGEETRIFERFYKGDAARQRGGTGLGLSIARHIVEAQGGQIWARNGRGGGACLTFTLPKAGQAASNAGG